MGIKFSENCLMKLLEYNKQPMCNTKITQNKDNEICFIRIQKHNHIVNVV